MSSFESYGLDALNHTELYQKCIRASLVVHPRSTREEMIGYLTGALVSPLMEEIDHPIHQWRYGIIGFLTEYWQTLAPQIKCPAKMLHHPQTPDPRPCFGCIDTQVIACACVLNGKNEKLISLHRKTRGMK